MCSGQVQNFWQGLGAFSVGAIAGGVASGTGAWAFSAFFGGGLNGIVAKCNVQTASISSVVRPVSSAIKGMKVFPENFGGSPFYS